MFYLMKLKYAIVSNINDMKIERSPFLGTPSNYIGCPHKAERSIFVTLIFENIAYFDFIK